MKRLISVGFIFFSISVLATTVVNAACSPAPTSGNDVIVCTSTTSGGIDGDDGNDMITNEGTLSGTSLGDMRGGDGDDILINNGFVGDEMRGDDGNDTIINNGIVAYYVQGDDGNDLLINNGTILSDDLEGNEGNDLLINNGTIGSNMEGEEDNDTLINNGVVYDLEGDEGNDLLINNGVVGNHMEGGDGNDIIINNGFVGNDIYGGDGDDYVIIGNGAIVGGLIIGGDGFDTLQFDINACLETDSETIRTALSISNLNPADDSVTINGNTYTWIEFEELLITLFAQFCDGRNEITDTATPLVSYCNIFNGLDIYDVNEIGVDGRSTEGLLTIRTTQLETREIVQLAVSSGQNQLIASDEYGNQLWALSSNELQIMGPEVTDPTKIYLFILPASVCGIN